MLDHLIRGASIVDGTGAPATTGDVGIRDGKIVSVGKVEESARETTDALMRFLDAPAGSPAV